MCQLINAACLMANFFEIHAGKNIIPLSELGKIGDKVEEVLRGQGVVVDWTRPGVMEAFDLYADLFKLQDGQALTTGRFGEFVEADFVKNEFNWGLPPSVVASMRKTIEHEWVAV